MRVIQQPVARLIPIVLDVAAFVLSAEAGIEQRPVF